MHRGSPAYRAPGLLYTLAKFILGFGDGSKRFRGGLPFIGSTPKDKYARYHPALYLVKKRFPGYTLIGQVEQPGEPS